MTSWRIWLTSMLHVPAMLRNHISQYFERMTLIRICGSRKFYQRGSKLLRFFFAVFWGFSFFFFFEGGGGGLVDEGREDPNTTKSGGPSSVCERDAI